MARIGTGGAAAVALLLAAALPQAALAQPAGIAPEAEKLLKASTDFFARQQRFSLDTQSSIGRRSRQTRISCSSQDSRHMTDRCRYGIVFQV